MAHRDYSIRGEYARVYIFDDRMEIFSPGKLPNMVTVDNIRETRFSAVQGAVLQALGRLCKARDPAKARLGGRLRKRKRRGG